MIMISLPTCNLINPWQLRINYAFLILILKQMFRLLWRGICTHYPRFSTVWNSLFCWILSFCTHYYRSSATLASLGEIKFHGYHTAMEEVTLFNDGRNLQVDGHILIEEDMTLFMILMVLSMKVNWRHHTHIIDLGHTMERRRRTLYQWWISSGFQTCVGYAVKLRMAV